MIRRPVQLAAARLPLAPASPPDLAEVGLDLPLAAQNVERAHGDAALFGRALAAGAGAAPDAVHDRSRALDLVAVAAWRAGALALRDDALARLAAADDPVHRRALAATLGLGVDVLEAFVRRQRADRFWWPGRVDDRGFVLAAGGFRGFGGAWIRPPERAVRLADAGAFAFLVAGEWWRLDADVWGSRLAASGEPGPASPVDDGVSIVIGADTHLAWVHVREAA